MSDYETQLRATCDEIFNQLSNMKKGDDYNIPLEKLQDLFGLQYITNDVFEQNYEKVSVYSDEQSFNPILRIKKK